MSILHRLRMRRMVMAPVLLLTCWALTPGDGSRALASTACQPNALPAPHCNSVAQESPDGNFTGISVFRPDETGTFANGCIYQSQWLYDSSDNWLELGSVIGGSCNYISSGNWYWGYGDGSTLTFYILGTRSIGPGPNHTFQFYKYLGSWNYFVDTTLLGSYSGFANNGTHIRAGLEAWTYTSTVTGYANSTLKFTTGGGSWRNWSNNIVYSYDHPPMCGLKVLATRWDSGMNVASC